MKSVFSNPIDCYGCGACIDACKRNAIQMKSDNHGFLYPIIDESKCINCKMCKSVCQIGKEKDIVHDRSDFCYGFKNADSIRSVSSSGGAFSAIIQSLKGNNGYVYGASFDENLMLTHSRNRVEDGTDAFKGSKYIQSNLEGVYKDILSLLDDFMVVFSGTPCQIAALYLFLTAFHGNIKNLITVDIVCHGVPSPIIWKEYINVIEGRYKCGASQYHFRDKTRGWRGYHISLCLSDGRIVKNDPWLDSYGVIYSKNLFLRQSCYHCPYSSLCRPSDITLGDFWGIEHIDKDFHDDLGVSSIIPNTIIGNKVVSGFINLPEYRTKQYIVDVLKQPNLHKSTDYPLNYESFWKAYEKKGTISVLKRYGNISRFYILKDRIDNFLNRH